MPSFEAEIAATMRLISVAPSSRFVGRRGWHHGDTGRVRQSRWSGMIRFSHANRGSRLLPGLHITNCQMRIYRKGRQTDTALITAAKSGFRPSIACRLERDQRLPSQPKVARVAVPNCAGSRGSFHIWTMDAKRTLAHRGQKPGFGPTGIQEKAIAHQRRFGYQGAR